MRLPTPPYGQEKSDPDTSHRSLSSSADCKVLFADLFCPQRNKFCKGFLATMATMEIAIEIENHGFLTACPTLPFALFDSSTKAASSPTPGRLASLVTLEIALSWLHEDLRYTMALNKSASAASTQPQRSFKSLPGNAPKQSSETWLEKRCAARLRIRRCTPTLLQTLHNIDTYT